MQSPPTERSYSGPAGNAGLQRHEYYDRARGKPDLNTVKTNAGILLRNASGIQMRPAPGGSFSFPGLEAPSADAPYTSSRPEASGRSNPGAEALAAAANAVLASPSPSSGKRSVRMHGEYRPVQVPQRVQRRSDPGKDWRWCLGGRQSEAPKASKLWLEAETTYKELGRSTSEPNFQPGVAPEPFYGEPRDFGLGVWDGRMRGGPNARNGWAGTFPLTHPRGCAPWAH